jgi:succinoglycan biosynthesis transport protein ExoP
MEQESLPLNPNRATAAAQFFNRVHRWLNILRSHWWVLLLGVGIAMGGEMYWSRHTPPAYASIGRMIVDSKMSLPGASAYSEDLNNFLGTQVGLMESDVVSNRALVRLKSEKPDLRPGPVDLDVTVSPKTSIFNYRVVGENPEYATAFLQALMGEYIAVKKEMLRDASDVTKTGLQQVLARLGTDLQSAKQELINYGAGNKEVYLQDQGNSAGDYLAALTKQLAGLKSELQLLKNLTLDENVERLVGLQQSLGQGATSPLPQTSVGLSQTAQFTTRSGTSSSGTTIPGQFGAGTTTTPSQMSTATPRPGQTASPTGNNSQPDQNSALVGSKEDYLKAKQVILLMKAQRDDLGKFLRPKHPKIIALNEDIDRMEKLLDIFRGQTRDQLKDRQHTLEVQIDNLEKDIKVWEVRTVDISQKMADYQAIKDKIVRLQNISDSLFATESTVNLTAQISPESVSILEPATPAVLATLPTARRAAVAALLGLVAAAGFLLFLDRLDDRPNSYSELQDLFDETILGQIPKVRVKDKKSGAPFIQEDDDRHALVEAFRNLRSSLVFLASPNEHPKIILVTSAIPGDGKSMTTANLAITIARSGARVLLVDADLRRGLIHKRFDIAATPGLTEVLGEQCLWTKAVTQNSVPNLYIIPRGSIPKHPGELFMKSIREKFLNEAGGQYDFILIDTPPIMAADDVLNVTPYVDGVLMVVRANYTSGRVARAALDLLYTRKANVLGVVFNGVRVSGGDYYYYKYKDYYASTPAA